MRNNIVATLLVFTAVLHLLLVYVIVMQDDIIDAEKVKHEVTKIELYDLKETIAEGLCLPRLQM